MKRALITGVTGQLGSYLAELLIEKGYHVHGVVRRTSAIVRSRIDHLPRTDPDRPGLSLVYGDLGDSSSLKDIVANCEADEIYNLASQSHVGISLEIPETTIDINCMGAVRMLDALRRAKRPMRFFQASSSEIFGRVKMAPQNEQTAFHPRNPYGVGKLASFWAAASYRENDGVFACNGIMYNQESPRRGENFVTRKITLGAARIKLGQQKELRLGNLDAARDWGYARDAVRAMWLILQHDTPDDYVIATGHLRTVRNFLDAAFGHLGLDWSGRVTVDPHYYRPAEDIPLVGDATRARERLGWRPEVPFEEMVRRMVEADLAYAKANPAASEGARP